jgi:uncharacterized protein
MPLIDYHHGAETDELSDSAVSVQDVATAVIGFVATAEDADPLAFPLNNAVLFTDPAAAIAKAGTKGTLASVLLGISKHVQSGPIVVVRVAEGADDAQTSSNVIGTTTAEGAYTGLQALLTAEGTLGVEPLIIGAPGLETEEVTIELQAVLQKLDGFGYAYLTGCKTVAECLVARAKYSARELMLVWPNFTRFDTTTSKTVVAETVGYALGLRAKMDATVGFHACISNNPVLGVNGIDRPVTFKFTQKGTDADLLNAAGITTLINRNGFRFWGARTCDDTKFIFESYTRTAQVLKKMLAETLFEFADKPMSATLFKDVLDAYNKKGAQYVRDGKLVGFSALFDPKKNTPDELKNGKGYISTKYTPVPPFEQAKVGLEFTDEYFVDLATAIVSGTT